MKWIQTTHLGSLPLMVDLGRSDYPVVIMSIASCYLKPIIRNSVLSSFSSLYNVVYVVYIIYGVIQGFQALRKAITTHVLKNYDFFSRV